MENKINTESALDINKIKLDSNTVIAILRLKANSKYKIYDHTRIKPLESIYIKLDRNPDGLIVKLDRVNRKIEVIHEEFILKDGEINASFLWSDRLTEDSMYRNCQLILDYIEGVMDWGSTEINIYDNKI